MMGFESAAESDQHHVRPSSNGVRWVLLVAFAVIVGLGILTIYSWSLNSLEQTEIGHPSVGNPLSVLKVEPFVAADQSYTQADLNGHVTLITYWGPWCPPCRLEMPHMAVIEKKYRHHDQFQFLPVTCGIWVYGSMDEMRFETTKYRNQAKLDFPLYSDPDYVSRAALESAIGLEPDKMSYPTTVLIDQQGKIAGVWEGFSMLVPEQIASAVDRLIEPH